MFLQEQIERLSQRIKRIEANPRPEYMYSNKLRYELELEQMQYTMDAWKEGKPFAILYNVEQLTRPLGFEHAGYIEWGDRVSDPLRYQDIAVNKFGFPDHTCDRTMTAMGLYLSGEVPVPRLMTSRRIPCDPERWSAMAAAKYLGVLFFEMIKLNSNGYENIQCVTEQIGNLIEFAERSVPGIKYDQDKLIELMEIDSQGFRYQADTYELRKRVPCPISPQDCFRIIRRPSRSHDPKKFLEYCRIYRDELYERAEKGLSGVPEEKLRIAWLATGPYGRETFDLLSRKGVSMVWFHRGGSSREMGRLPADFGDETAYGKKLTPLEEVARDWSNNIWGGDAAMWVDPLIDACRELKVDAVVDFLQVGCVTVKNLKRIVSQRLREELGIPTLDLEGREHFMSDVDRLSMNKKLEEFLDMCIANKT